MTDLANRLEYICELQARIEQLEELCNNVVEAYCLIDGMMAEDDCNRLWEQIDKLQKALEGK